MSPHRHRSSIQHAGRPKLLSICTAAMHARTPDKTTSTSHPSYLRFAPVSRRKTPLLFDPIAGPHGFDPAEPEAVPEFEFNQSRYG